MSLLTSDWVLLLSADSLTIGSMSLLGSNLTLSDDLLTWVNSPLTSANPKQKILPTTEFNTYKYTNNIIVYYAYPPNTSILCIILKIAIAVVN